MPARVTLERSRINLPVWLLILLVLVMVIYDYMTYVLGKRALVKTPVVGDETMVGIKCRTTTPLRPDGYVRVGSELWRARSISGDIDEDTEVIIESRKELTFLVVLSPDDRSS